MKCILFVDDEPKLLDGLKRLLRPQRAEWEMLFAPGGGEALVLMEQRRVDVIVTDMRMPGMDGAALLQHVYERYPGVIRIVLSGQFDQETGTRAAPFAHQFLTKPCDPVQLKAAIARSADTCTCLPDEATQKIVRAVGTLPSPPKIYAQLMAAINDPEASLDAISRIIDHDVGLSAKILHLGNSAFFGLTNEVTGIRQAVSAFGLEVLKQLVVSAGILREFRPLKANPHFSIEEFERHSAWTAELAAQLPGKDDASSRALAGLLHDTGKLVLACKLPHEFAEACKIADTEGIPAFLAEERVFGTSHAEIGACLLRLWGLPAAMTAAIARHHHPAAIGSQSAGLDLLTVIHLASAFAHEKANPAVNVAEVSTYLDQEFAAQPGMAERIAKWRDAFVGTQVA